MKKDGNERLVIHYHLWIPFRYFLYLLYIDALVIQLFFGVQNGGI